MLQERFDEIWNSLESKPHQRTYDFKWVIDEVEKIKPKVILEIGLANGGSLKYWEQILLECNKNSDDKLNDYSDCLLISLENNPGCIPLWKWTDSKIDIHIIYGNSDSTVIAEKVKDILVHEDKKIDFLMIDGGHRYSVPERDFNNYSPFVKDNGIICIADLGEPCPAHVLLQLPELREVDPTIGMAIWRKQRGKDGTDIKVKECDNHGQSTGEAYTKILDIFRFRVPNPP